MKHQPNDLTNLLHRPVETAALFGHFSFSKPDIVNPASYVGIAIASNMLSSFKPKLHRRLFTNFPNDAETSKTAKVSNIIGNAINHRNRASPPVSIAISLTQVRLSTDTKQ